MLKAVIVTLIVALFIAVNGYAVAKGASKGKQEVSKEKLEEIENQLHEAQQKNEETKQSIVQLEKKVQCTYKLVKGYESCDASFTEKNKDYVACIERARKEKDDCMEQMASESE